MKKVFIIIALFTNVVVYGQGKDTVNIIYYDAVKLSSNLTKDSIVHLLKPYGIDKQTTCEEIPYFKNTRFCYLFEERNSGNKERDSVNDDTNDTRKGNDIFSGFLSALGNTNVIYFATGLSQFLAERAKEELNEAFLNGMHDKLEAYPELRVLFPQTWATMQNIDYYGYAYIPQLLKYAFETDMLTLPQNLNNIIEGNFSCGLKKDKKCEDRQKELKKFFNTIDGQWFSFGLYVLNEAQTARNPAKLLNAIAEYPKMETLKKSLEDSFKERNTAIAELNLLSFIELSDVISQSLLSKDGEHVWITKQQLDVLLKDTTVFNIYLGLLLAKEKQKDDSVKIKLYKNDGTSISFKNILEEEHFEEFVTLIRNIYTVFSVGNDAVDKMRLAMENSENIDSRSLIDFYRTVSNSIRPLVNFIGMINSQIELPKQEKIDNILNPAVDLYYHILDKQYSAAVFDVYILMGNIKIELPFRQSFLKYGMLIADVANAKSSDEVRKAIAASAMPVGSSAMKRNNAFSVMLQAYVGAYGGSVLHHNDSLNEYQKNAAYGIFAPIGVSLNTGFKRNHALSLNFQLLDLGSLVNFYLKNGDNAVLPTDYKVNLIDVFSPGVQFGYLIPRTPLTAFVGTSYIPAFYKTAENTYNGGYRWQIGVAIDIPMYKLSGK